MKTLNITSLPQKINYNKKVYVCDHDFSIDKIFESGKEIPKGYIKVLVLQRNLKGKINAFNQPYKPSVFYFKPQILFETGISIPYPKQINKY